MGEPNVVVRQFIERRPKRKAPYGKGEFMLMSRSGFSELKRRCRDHTLGARAVAVLFGMLEHTDYLNRVEISQKDLAADLGMTASEVSQCSRVLMECGFIRRMSNRRGWYEIDPRMGWKGNVESLEMALLNQKAERRVHA